MTQSYYQTPQYQTKPRKYKGWGCLMFILVPILLVVLIIVGIFFIYPKLSPNSLKGDLVDMTYVAGKDGSGKLWVVSDGSFYYVSSYETPGHKEWGSKCLFCKLYTYIYDPVQKKIIQTLQTDYDGLPPKTKLFYVDGSVWVVNRDQFENLPAIHKYNAQTGEEIMNTDGFIKKFPQLSAGITELSINENPSALDITTSDGQSFFYSIEYDKLFANRKEMNEFFKKTDTEIKTVFMLAEESGTPRKILYKVKGPGSIINDEHMLSNQLDDPENLKRHYDSESTLLTPDRVFIEGIILCYTDDAAVILHQNRVGKKADRLLTCVNADGEVRWTIPPTELFEELKIDEEEDPFSKIFFMKDKISGSISDNVMIFKLTPVGIIGFDFKTGKKLWTVEF
ncbi:hypothetical protein ACFLSV_08250 [Bacteroidota bacterium]